MTGAGVHFHLIQLFKVVFSSSPDNFVINLNSVHTRTFSVSKIVLFF
jgi:hypothetical protein